MAAGDRIPLVARYVHTGVSTPIAGATHALLEIETVVAEEPPKAGEAGEAGQAITMYRLRLTVYGNDPSALIALYGAAAANKVIGFKDAGGANKNVTLKNVGFTRFGSALAFPAIDVGGRVGPWALSGRCEWGGADTLALMMAFADDT